jgi:crotonobetainyl-CoA:carnitine CoA-transferase CaiB-like acyl-CoA transferase
VFLQSGELTMFAGRPQAQSGGTDFAGPSAVRRYYQAADGWLAVAATTAAHAEGLLSAVGHPEWSTRADDALAGCLAESLVARTVDTWVARLTAHGVPACRVLPRAGELADPFLVENAFSHVVEDPVVGKLRVVRGFSDWPGTVAEPGRTAGGSTADGEITAVLAAAGIGLKTRPAAPPVALP